MENMKRMNNLLKKTRKLVVSILLFALVLGMIPATKVSAAAKVSLSAKSLTITKGKSKTLKVKNTEQEVKWSILSGKKCITLTKKDKAEVTIKGIKKGTAKVQAVVGKNKLTCKITVKKAAKANEPAGANKQDVAALKALIAEQRGRGATVSEDMSSEQYEWKDGRLVTINWFGEKSLTGDISFSALTALTKLYCGINNLSSLDVSGNVNLTELYCFGNQLSSLDVSKNVNLEILNCSSNQLSSLNTGKNANLTELYCHENQLGSLGIGENINLTVLYCYENQLRSLDVSKNVNLTGLWCYNNSLGSLNVSDNVKLEILSCGNNQLSSLDVSKDVNLTELYCENNNLSSLDLTANSKLTTLFRDETVTLTGYNPTNAPAGANEQDVAALVALIMEQREGGATVSKDMSSDQYEWKDGRLVTISWSKKGLTGDISFSAFTALTKLDCSDNQLKSLDVSGNVNLEKLNCSRNPISSLDLSNNTKLKEWSYPGNITVIDPDDWD